jgi:hypothetical protein
MLHFSQIHPFIYPSPLSFPPTPTIQQLSVHLVLPPSSRDAEYFSIVHCHLLSPTVTICKCYRAHLTPVVHRVVGLGLCFAK